MYNNKHSKTTLTCNFYFFLIAKFINNFSTRYKTYQVRLESTRQYQWAQNKHYRSKQDPGIMPTSFLSFHVSSSHILTDASLNLTIQFKMLGIVFISSLIRFKLKATRMPYKLNTKQFDNYLH
jgi:hypothetical protein